MLPGPLADFFAIGRFNGEPAEHDAQADQRHQDAQHEREVTRTHAGAAAHAVGGGAPCERHAHDGEHQSREKVFLTFDFHEQSPRTISMRDCRVSLRSGRCGFH
ncbi:hypothetical protein D3C87_1798080 [compost metagenome]